MNELQIPRNINEANVKDFIQGITTIETIYFTQSEFKLMTPLMLKILISLFPNIKYPIPANVPCSTAVKNNPKNKPWIV